VGMTDVLRAVRQHWLIVVACVLVAIAAAWFTRADESEAAQTETWEADVILSASLQNPALGIGTPEPEAVREFVFLYRVAERAARQLDYDGDPRDLTGRVSAGVDPESGFVTITGSGPDPESAEELADAFAIAVIGFLQDLRADATGPYIAQLEAQIEALRETDPNSVLIDQFENQLQALAVAQFDPGYLRLGNDPAQAAPEVGFQPPRSFSVRALIAGLIGLALGLGIAVLLARVDTRIRSKSVAEQGFALPVLAEIPQIPRSQRDTIVSAVEPTSLPAEAFRLLGSEVARWSIKNGKGKAAFASSNEPRALLVTSSGPSEGKTTVAANLAVALAETGKRVIVLSCDFRHPDVHRFFGVPNDTGLVDALSAANGRPLLDECTWDTPHESVRIVPSGPARETPSMLLSSEHMRTAVDEAKAVADIVVLDSAPILAVSDAAYLLPFVDGVLVVARAGWTRPEIAARTTEVLERLGAPILGVVLNAAKEIPVPSGYHAYVRAREDGHAENPHLSRPSTED
jgi:capsular exopolysaccharide synthesis family protein